MVACAKQLHDILPQADFLLILLPLTQETQGLIGRRELDLLPAHAGVINLGRGAVIDNDALADKLRKGELSGAVLDVYPEEPLPRSSAALGHAQPDHEPTLRDR